MGAKNETATVAWKSMDLGKRQVSEKEIFEVIACIIKFGMDWKQRIDMECLTSITKTEKVKKEIKDILVKAGPVAIRELLVLKEKQAEKDKQMLQSKVDLVTQYLHEQRVKENYERNNSNHSDLAGANRTSNVERVD